MKKYIAEWEKAMKDICGNCLHCKKFISGFFSEFFCDYPVPHWVEEDHKVDPFIEVDCTQFKYRYYDIQVTP